VAKFIFSVVIGAALAVSVRAGDFKLPDDSPVASFTIPASWSPSEYEDGVEATSDDGSIYIAVEAADISSSKDVSGAMTESLKYLTKKGVTVNSDSVKQTDAKINGMDVVDISWDGKDSEGACRVSLSIVIVTAKKGLLLTYWGSPEGSKKYGKDLDAIAESIKPL
jgi:hypothetical protein